MDGNILANKPRTSTDDWWIDIPTNTDKSKTQSRKISNGGIATACSKTIHHYIDGRSCLPLENKPKSISVLADSCTEAGMLSTLAACLKATDAFLPVSTTCWFIASPRQTSPPNPHKVYISGKLHVFRM